MLKEIYEVTQSGRVVSCEKIAINKYENKLTCLHFNYDNQIADGRKYIAILNPKTKRYRILPLSLDDTVTLSTDISRYPGIWQLILLVTEDDYEITNDDIDQTKCTYVSNIAKFIVVRDNFLSDETIEEEDSPAIQQLIDETVAMRCTLESYALGANEDYNKASQLALQAQSSADEASSSEISAKESAEIAVANAEASTLSAENAKASEDIAVECKNTVEALTEEVRTDTEFVRTTAQEILTNTETAVSSANLAEEYKNQAETASQEAVAANAEIQMSKDEIIENINTARELLSNYSTMGDGTKFLSDDGSYKETNAVTFTEQSLTANQKEQVLTNIDAVGRKSSWNGSEIFNYRGNRVYGDYSHAEGYNTYSGKYAHAEGCNTIASGESTHSEGNTSQALNSYAHAEGYKTTSQGIAAHAEGGNIDTGGINLKTKTYTPSDFSDLTKTYNIDGSYACGIQSHAEETQTFAYGHSSHAEGYQTLTTGLYSHAEGYGCYATSSGAHAEGLNTKSTLYGAHSEGCYTTASGQYSHSEGISSTASGQSSHAEGRGTTASGDYSHSEGDSSTASGSVSHAEGYKTKASGNVSHAEGNGTTASGQFSHSEGGYTIASGNTQHVQGKYNIEDSKSKYAHIVGNGTSSNERSNAHTLDWEGNSWYAGDVFVGGTSQDDENAKKLATEEYVNDLINNQLLFNDAGELVVTLNGVSKTFVPKE